MDWFSCVTPQVYPCGYMGILNSRCHNTDPPSDCLRSLEIWDGDSCWHVKCITTGFQDYWVSLLISIGLPLGKLFGFSLVSLFIRSNQHLPTPYFMMMWGIITHCVLSFAEHYVRDMIFINYVLAFIAYFMLLLRLYSWLLSLMLL